MYLNINSECKYTHIYLINNTSCNFFCPGAPLARFWARQTLPAKPAEGHAPNIDCFRRGVPARRDPAFARRHAGRRALCIGCSRDAAPGPAHAVRPGRRRGDFGFLHGLRRGAHAAPRRSRTAAGLRRGVAAGRTDGVEPLGVRRRPVHDLSREPSAIADEDRQRLEPTVMTETLLMLYTMFAAAGTFALLSLLGAVELRARRQRSRDAALRAKYLRIVMLYLLAGEGPAPRFPMIRRAGARLLLVETVAGLAGVTYGLDAAPLRRIVAEYGLDAWLLRRTARSRGYRRARCLLLLSRLPVGAAAADCAARYAASRNRYVRFQSLMVRLAADPSTALRLMAEYPEPFSACEVGEIMAVLRRGMLPIAYEPLIGSPSRNLRIVGLNIVRQFGIEEAERLLLRIVSGDEDPELVREALYTLCALRRPLTRRAVSGRLSAMPPAERKALLRYVVAEGYSPGPLRRLLDERERPYYESLVQTYKRSLA